MKRKDILELALRNYKDNPKKAGEMSGESLSEVIIAALIDIKTKRNEKPDTDFI